MRAFEFKHPIKEAEAVSTPISTQGAVVLNQALDKAIAMAKQIGNKIKKPIRKIIPTNQPAESIREAKADYLTLIAEAKKDLDVLAKLLPPATAESQKILDGFKQKIAELEKIHQRELKKAEKTGGAKEEQDFKQWFQSIKQILLALGKKAQGYSDLTDEDLKAMTSKQRSSAKKVAVNAQKFAEDLGQSLQALFLHKIYGQEETSLSRDKVLNFLQDALNGSVIDNARMIQEKGVGNLENYFDPSYKDVFDEIKDELFKLKPPAAGSANIGPGELALAMLGNPAEKPDKGDIKIGEEMFEIKAGAGPVGGRFNSSEVGKANEGWNTWTKGLKEIVPDKDFTDRFTSETKSSGKTRQKLASKYNWNTKGVDALNKEVLEPYSDFEKTKKLLTDTFKIIIKNHDKLSSFDKAIDKMINPSDGTLVPNFMQFYARMVYESYNEADGVTNIILINTDNLQFTIIRSGQDLMKRIGKDFRSSGGFNWNDNQQTASPQFVLA